MRRPSLRPPIKRRVFLGRLGRVEVVWGWCSKATRRGFWKQRDQLLNWRTQVLQGGVIEDVAHVVVKDP